MKPKTTAKSNLKSGNRNGRPALPENEKQSIIRPTKFNKKQDAVLMENFHRSGLSCVSEYIRAVSLNPKIVPRLTEEELRIARALSGFSNNFNQFVRLCHIHGLEAMAAEAEFYLGKFRCLFGKFNND